MERFRNEVPDKHNGCLRDCKECFDDIFVYVKSAIENQNTLRRSTIPANQRLCVTPFIWQQGRELKYSKKRLAVTDYKHYIKTFPCPSVYKTFFQLPNLAVEIEQSLFTPAQCLH